MLKRHMTPLTKGGALHKHVGKGAIEKPLTPTPSSGGSPTFGQNYTKPDPTSQAPDPSEPDADDLSGTSSGG